MHTTSRTGGQGTHPTFNLRGLKPWQRRVAEGRAETVRAVDRLVARGLPKSAAIDAVVTAGHAGLLPEPAKVPSRQTVRRWLDHSRRGGLQALAPRWPGPARPEPAWLDDFVKMYRERTGRPSIAACYAEFARKRDDLPSLRSVQRWVRKVDPSRRTKAG